MTQQYLAIKDHIIFQFIDELDERGQFIEKTDSIILVYGDKESSANNPRWGIVTHIGPEVQDVKVGDKVLVSNLKWTMAFKIDNDGPKYWRTDEQHILGIEE